MKELSIEEKARRYDEALKVAKSNYDTIIEMDEECTFAKEGIVNTFVHMFPELRESEDERMIRIIEDAICTNEAQQLVKTKYGLELTDLADWLEKQKTSNEALQYLKENHSPSEMSDFQAAMNIAVVKAFDAGKKQGEQKPANWLQELEDILANATPKQLAEWKEKYFKDEPAWSEEDEDIKQSIIDILTRQGFQTQVDWLKSLKDRVQPSKKWGEDDRIRIANCIQLIGKTGDGEVEWLKSLENRILPQTKQERSEEDIVMRNDCIAINAANEVNYTAEEKERFTNWLSSLCSQKQWNPSDDEMEALAWALSLAKSCGEESCYDLRTLYEKLKKLKEG